MKYTKKKNENLQNIHLITKNFVNLLVYFKEKSYLCK